MSPHERPIFGLIMEQSGCSDKPTEPRLAIVRGRSRPFWCSACGHRFRSEASDFGPEGCPECHSLAIEQDTAGQPRDPSYDDSREVTGRGEY